MFDGNLLKRGPHFHPFFHRSLLPQRPVEAGPVNGCSKQGCSECWPRGRGGVYGTRVHTAFEAEVNSLDDANLATEVSYVNGKVFARGTPKSIRVDVVEGPVENPNAIYDLKTGTAKLTPARIRQIRANLPEGAKDIPIETVRP